MFIRAYKCSNRAWYSRTVPVCMNLLNSSMKSFRKGPPSLQGIPFYEIFPLYLIIFSQQPLLPQIRNFSQKEGYNFNFLLIPCVVHQKILITPPDPGAGICSFKQGNLYLWKGNNLHWQVRFNVADELVWFRDSNGLIRFKLSTGPVRFTPLIELVHHFSLESDPTLFSIAPDFRVLPKADSHRGEEGKTLFLLHASVANNFNTSPNGASPQIHSTITSSCWRNCHCYSHISFMNSVSRWSTLFMVDSAATAITCFTIAAFPLDLVREVTAGYAQPTPRALIPPHQKIYSCLQIYKRGREREKQRKIDWLIAWGKYILHLILFMEKMPIYRLQMTEKMSRKGEWEPTGGCNRRTAGR